MVLRDASASKNVLVTFVGVEVTYLGFHTYMKLVRTSRFSTVASSTVSSRIAAIPTVRLNRQLQDLEACLNYNLLTDKPSYRLLCHFGLDYSSLIFPEVSWGKNMGDKVIPVKVAVRVRPLVPKEVRILTTFPQYSLW